MTKTTNEVTMMGQVQKGLQVSGTYLYCKFIAIALDEKGCIDTKGKGCSPQNLIGGQGCNRNRMEQHECFR